MHLKCIGREDKFLIEPEATSQGLPYDYESIMHHRYNAFSFKNYFTTMQPRRRATRLSAMMLGESVSGTNLDFLHVVLLYCGGR